MNQLHHAGGMRGWQKLLSAILLVCSLVGCATSGNPRDPLEGYNRVMFGFNDAVDKAALKPVATVYQKVTPSFLQTAVGNFFGNLGDVWTAVNNALQGKGKEAASDVMRVAVNSTFGLAGLLDVASEARLPKHREDFGQTLGKWGVQSGPYIVLPFLGPSTMRDTVGLPLDLAADPWAYKKPKGVRYAGTLLKVVDQRASLLDASNLLEEAALDRYEFIRDGFLQRRESKVNDGESGKYDESSQVEPADQSIKPIAESNSVLDSAANKVKDEAGLTKAAIPATSAEKELAKNDTAIISANPVEVNASSVPGKADAAPNNAASVVLKTNPAINIAAEK